MIYFLNNELQLQKIVTSENLISAYHEDEKNNLKMMTLELDLAYAKSFLNDDIDHFGYYVGDDFHVAKIRRVEESHNGEILTLIGHHILFSDMIYGRLIEDVRPVNRDAAFILNQTIGANTRWNPVITDTTGVLSTNFYWTTPMEVIEFVVENFRLEFQPEILFDGQKVNGLNLHFKKRLGEDKPRRIVYGPKTPTLKYDIDYSEIVTKLAVHGKGEEVGDGYGRRINFSDRNINRDGIISPLGSRYLEDPNVTANYGNFDNEPKHANVIFEDIENVNELIEAGIEEYERLSRPQYIFTATVADIGDVNMGDSVLIVRREHGIYFRARVHKISIDLLNPQNAEVVLGDYEHFKETKAERSARRQRENNERAVNSRITQLKNAFDARFDGEVTQMREEFEQAVIDAHAEIDAAEQRMADLIETERDTMMDDYNEKVEGARRHAEQQAQERADSVRTDLETVTSGHQSMLDDLESNVMNIDDFLGPRDRTLQSILDDQRIELEQKIEVYSRNYPNLVVGSTLENIDGFEGFIGSEFELITNESLNYIRVYDNGDTNTPSYYFPDTVFLEQGKTYTLALDFRSDVVEDLDYIHFMGLGSTPNVSLDVNLTRGLVADGEWHRYYFTLTWVNTTRQARLMIGTNFSRADMNRGWFDTRQVHLYKGDTHNIPWTPSPSDNAQVVSQLLFEMRQLEDGMSTLATKTEVDLLTGNVTQLTNEYLSTSEQVSSKLQNLDDVLGVNGSHFIQIADQVQSKVWLNDFTNINPNLIPFADVRNISDMSEYWNRFGTNSSGSHANALDSDGFYVFRDTVAESNLALESSTFEEIKEGEQYTLSFLAKTHSNINDNYNYTYIINPSGSNHPLGMWTNRKHIKDNIYLYEWIFEARWTGEARVLIGSNTTPGTDANIRFKEPKLERGSKRTPFLNAFSNIDQLANKISLQVQELDGEYLSQSDIEIKPDYVQLGSQRLGDSQLASIFRVSPNSIDAITSNLNLSGNLNTKGQITSLAVDAIEGEFARLWAAEFSAITIDVDDISGLTARFEWLYTLNANIERLVSQNVFANGVSAISLDAVYGDISKLRTELLTANVIQSEHLRVNSALANKFNASTAFISRLEVQAGNIRDLSAIHIRGGLLDSLNGNARLNLNTGDWTLGGNAHIQFTNRNNRMFYRNNGIETGLQFDHSLNSGGNPGLFLGVTDVTLDANDSTFRGLRVHSAGTESNLGYGTNIVSERFAVLSRAHGNGSGFDFTLHATGGATRGIFPRRTSEYTYNLGSLLNRWREVWMDDIRTGGDGSVRIMDGASSSGNGGYTFNTRVLSGDNHNITFRPVNTFTNYYDLGHRSYRWHRMYINNSPDVSSDRRLKEEIEVSKLGLDFINDLQPKQFRLKPQKPDIDRNIYKKEMQYGIIAQELLESLANHGVDTSDISMVSQDSEYMGVQYEQLIAPTIKAVQELSFVQTDHEKRIAELESENKRLRELIE